MRYVGRHRRGAHVPRHYTKGGYRGGLPAASVPPPRPVPSDLARYRSEVAP